MPPNRNPTGRWIGAAVALATVAVVAIVLFVTASAPVIQTGGTYGDGQRAALIADAVSAGNTLVAALHTTLAGNDSMIVDTLSAQLTQLLNSVANDTVRNDTLSALLAQNAALAESLGVINQSLIDSLAAVNAAAIAAAAPFDTFDCGWWTLGASGDTTFAFGNIEWFEFGTDAEIRLHLYLPSGQEDTLRLLSGTDNKRWSCDSIEVDATAAGATFDYRFAGHR